MSFAGVLFAGLVGLHSCQNVYQEDCTLQTWTLRVAPDSASFPDSVPWSGPWETGLARMAREKTSGRLELDLHLPLEQDTLQLEWRQMGVRQKTVWCVRSDDPKVLVAKRELPDSLGTKLLGEFWRRRGSSPANAEPATAIGLRRFFATRLLAGDSVFRPFPASAPAGIHPDSARLDTWVAACQSGWPMFRVLGTWSLSTDSAALRRGVESLVKSGRISSSDTNALFQAPLRARGTLFQTDFVQGDSTRPTGSFSWAAGLEIDVRAAVRLRNFSSDSIVVSVVSPPGAQDTAWDVSKGVSLRASANTAIGQDTLVVWLRDRKGRYALESRAVFKILPRALVAVAHDSVPPSIDHPALPATVDWSVFDTMVRWSVTDRFRLDSIWIDSRPVPLDATGFYPYRMVLGVGTNQVVLQARDSAGNFNSDTIQIYRKADAVPPLATAQTGGGSRQVPFDSVRASAMWHVSDNHKLASCQIDGVERLQATATGEWICQVTLDLAVGTNFALLALRDSFGNMAYDTIRIERLKDAAYPTARVLAGQGTRVVPFDSARAWVGWDVADSYGLAFCKIAGTDRLQPAPGGGWVCRTEIVLEIGRNSAPMVLQDSAGNWIRDTIRIERLKDATFPVAKPLAGALSRTVAFDTSKAMAGWSVQDNHRLVSCKIGGQERLQPASGGGWVCQAELALSVGTNVAALRLEDSTGNVTLDTIRVQRDKDKVPPVALVMPGLGSRKLEFDSARVSIGWKVSDNHLVASCAIGGRPVSVSSGGICSTSVLLPVATTVIRLEVADSTGNLRLDSVAIERLADAQPPSVRTVGPDTFHVANSAEQAKVRWIVGDNHLVASAIFESWKLPLDGDTVEASMLLYVGGNEFRLTVRDSTGNATISRAMVYRDALAPRHRVDSLFFGGSVPDTLDCPTGCDSIEISRDRISWTRVDGIAMLDAPGLWHARSHPGKAESSISLRQAPLTENVFAGMSTSFFLRRDSLFAAGLNDVGQLGTAARSPTQVLAPVFVRKGVKKVVGGEAFTLMLLSDGQVVGAGAGPLVAWNGPSLGRDLWQVSTRSVDIAAGKDFFLVLDSDGKVWSAGANQAGQLGTGDSASRTALSLASTGVVAVAAGWSHAVRLDSAGSVWAVGSNGWGQLGSLAQTDASGWRKVDSLADAVYSSMGNATLYRGKDRRVRGLGANDQGQISSSMGAIVSDPVVLYPADAAWAGGGASHVLVLMGNGDLKVAGSNLEGQIGLGTQTNSSGFYWLATGLVGAATGRNHSLVVKDSGEPMGMGANSEGELGLGAIGNRTSLTRILH